MTWPNGGDFGLAPGDYYRVRFTADHAPATVGDEGVVVEHLLSASGGCGCAVEVGPWNEHGAPRGVVLVDASKLELLPAAISEDERRKLALREHTRDAFEGPRDYSGGDGPTGRADPTHFSAGGRDALCKKPSPERLTGCVDGVLCASCLVKLGRAPTNGFLYCSACDKLVLVTVKAEGMCCSRCRLVLEECVTR